MSTLLEDLKRYFAETPREKVLADWARSKEATKGVKSPTVDEFINYHKKFHEFKSLTIKVVMNNSAYEFINLAGKEDYTETDLNKGC